VARVALVDDDIEFLDELAKYLSAGGFSVTVWHRPALAWRFIRRERPDAVLLDFDMPGVSGLQILERLRATSETRGIPVLLLTAHDHPEIREGGWSHQLDDFIPKGTERSEIRLRLARAVERAGEHRNQASASGLPAGPAGRDRFAGALRENFGDAPGAPGEPRAAVPREESIFVLRLAGFENLARSDRPELHKAFRELLHRLAHRLRDALGTWPGREGPFAPAPIWQSSGDTIFFCSPAMKRSSDASPVEAPEHLDVYSVRRILRRRTEAANRLLGVIGGGATEYLAEDGGRLIRFILPAFGLHEFRLRDAPTWNPDRMLALAEEVLISGETSPGFQIHDL
jgi:CheY-like chemotaxis protein